MIKTYKATYELMKKLASSHHQVVYDKTVKKPMHEVLQMDAFNVQYAPFAAMSKKMQILENQSKAIGSVFRVHHQVVWTSHA